MENTNSMSVKLRPNTLSDRQLNTAPGKEVERPIDTKYSVAHLAWFTMFISIFIWNISTGTSTTAQSNELGNTGNVYRIFLVMFSLAAGAYALMKNSGNLSKRLTLPIILFIIYAIVAFLSSLLVPVNSFYTMWKSMEIMIDLMIILAILCHAYPYENILKTYKLTIILLVILLAIFTIEAIVVPSIVLLPSRGTIPFTMRGYIPLYNGNSLAFLCAVVAFYSFSRMINFKKYKAVYIILFAWSFIVLILAQSRTSLVGLMVAILVFTYFNKNRKTFYSLISLSVLLSLLASVASSIEAYLTRGQSAELMGSLSGRTHGWEASMEAFYASPIVGHGFAAAARTEILGVGGASTLHGAIFDVMVGTGLMGLIPWLLSIILIGKALLHRKAIETIGGAYKIQHYEFMGLFALLMVRSLTSSGIAFHEHTLMLLLIIYGYIASLPSLYLRHKS